MAGYELITKGVMYSFWWWGASVIARLTFLKLGLVSLFVYEMTAPKEPTKAVGTLAGDWRWTKMENRVDKGCINWDKKYMICLFTKNFMNRLELCIYACILTMCCTLCCTYPSFLTLKSSRKVGIIR